MLSRFVRFQLVAFAVLGLVGLLVTTFVYIQVQSLVGVGRIRVTVDLPTAGGLYRFANVTYRGVEVGKVTAVDLTPDGVQATLSIDDDHDIPADLEAHVRSVSAVGEQYVDLRPRSDGAPFLEDGAAIAATDTTVPQPVGPMLDNLSALVGSIPTDKLDDLLDEMYAGVSGAGYDLGSLLDSSSTLAADANSVADRTRTLIEDTVPLLDSQVRSLDAIDVWTRSLAGVTGQLVSDDPQLRTVLRTGPGFAQETAALFDTVDLTLPVMLANLTTVGQLAVTYNAGLEQLLVLLPPAVSMIQAVQPSKNASGLGLGDFRIGGISDPPACTVGFLPPSQWRPPYETDTVDTPEDLYCKLPQDSQIAVRGARNIPCANDPAKRAATAALCNSDQEFVPLATEQPVVGPYPHDPNLEAQGLPQDSRYNPDGSLVPPETTLPPIPSAHGIGGAPAGTEPASAQYDPRTGRYFGPDGQLYRQGDLAAGAAPASWQDMIPH
ncbi:MCE family protein [Rhodococcus phenolicus]|uniref:MCE family protein n=1 Tax=Rhodococcus phenolicus TaxID=263849 RepID=UPI00083076F0|nr:MlaD family protein [Rhodococcus phenolicus]